MLHRKILDNPIVSKPKYCHLWVVLLLRAQHKRSDFIWDNQRQTLLPGQLITGRKQLSQETKIPESTVERILKYLESEHQIGQQTTPKFRIITIKNWEKYQSPQQSGQQMDNRWTHTIMITTTTMPTMINIVRTLTSSDSPNYS